MPFPPPLQSRQISGRENDIVAAIVSMLAPGYIKTQTGLPFSKKYDDDEYIW